MSAPAAEITLGRAEARARAALLRSCSIEVTSREPKTITSCRDHLEPGSEIYLTWIPGDPPGHCVEAAATLRRDGFVPTPHIGARHIASRDELDDIVRRLVGEAGVDQVLLIAGDRDQPAGPFESSLQVIETGLLQKHGIRRVGISGFPEGNPKIPDAVLVSAMAAKLDAARAAGLAAHIVTQFCFEAEPILSWLRALRRAGITAPARIGLAGPASIATLTRFALRCGVGNSIRALSRAPSLTRLLTDSSPDPIVDGLASAHVLDPYLGIAGLHFFVFGGFAKTTGWIRDARG